MEALLAAELPDGDGWQFEPKWDGFRCLAYRDGAEVTLTSKSGKPLARYFPEVVEMLHHLKSKQFLLDGELIIPSGDALSFEALQLRRSLAGPHHRTERRHHQCAVDVRDEDRRRRLADRG